MDHDIDLVLAHAKEPARFDNFEAFVHHRGRINGDAVSHAPVGMRKRLFDPDVRQRGQRRLSKRTARRGQDQPPHFSACSATQALMHGVVFAIYGKKFAPGLFCRGHHQFARRDKDLFVRKRDRLSLLDRFVSRFQPDDAHCCRDHDVYPWVCSGRQQSFTAMVNLRGRRDSLFAQHPRQLISPLRIPDGDDFRVVPLDLPDQLFQVGSRRQRDHTKPLRQSLHHRKALPPNRSARTQNG